MATLNTLDTRRVCPYCGGPTSWRFGIVWHADYIHIKLRVQPPGCVRIQTLATIAERRRRKTPRGFALASSEEF